MAYLTGKQIGELQEMIMRAFSPDELEQLLRFRLDRQLQDFTVTSQPYPKIVFDVINTAERLGWTVLLLNAIEAERPNRPDVQNLVVELLRQLRGPGSDGPERKEVDRLASEAIRCQLRGNLGDALQLLREVKTIDPNYPRIDIRIAEVERELRSRYVNRDGNVDKKLIYPTPRTYASPMPSLPSSTWSGPSPSPRRAMPGYVVIAGLFLLVVVAGITFAIKPWENRGPSVTQVAYVTPSDIATRSTSGPLAGTPLPAIITPIVASDTTPVSTPVATITATGTRVAIATRSTAPVITTDNAGSVAQTEAVVIFGSPADVAVSPDGQPLAVATHFNILTYDLDNLEAPALTLTEHGPASQVAFSPDGRLLASADSGSNYSIRLWDMTAGGAERVLEGHTEAIQEIAFSPDGKLLASAGGRDQTVRLWDVATGKETFSSMAHGNEVHSVAFSPDGATLASGGNDGKIRLWDVASGQAGQVLNTGSIGVDALAFSPDGRLLASAGEYDPGIRLWDTQTWQPVTILRWKAEGDASHYGIYSLAFNPEGTLLASGGWDKTVRLWDVRRDSPSFAKELATLPGHSDSVDSVLFTPDSTTLISASDRDTTIRSWAAMAASTSAAVAAMPAASTPTAAAAMASGAPITAENAGSVAQADWTKPFGFPSDVALSPDGKTLAATIAKVGIFDLGDLETPRFEVGTDQGSNQVAFSPDGKLLASADSGSNYSIRMWDMTAGGAERGELEGHTEAIQDIAFSPDGRLLASAGGRDQTVRLWDVATGKQTFSSLAHGKEVHGVAFSPDGRILASGGNDGKIRLWDVASGQAGQVLDTGSIGVDALAFSPDGTLLASAGEYDPGIRLWNTQTWQPVTILRWKAEGDASHYGIYSLAFNPTGTLLASGGWDKTVRLWDVRRDSPSFAKELATLLGHSDWVDSVLFTPDSTTLISASRRDGTVRFWEVAARSQ